MSSNTEEANPAPISTETNNTKDYELLREDYSTYDLSFKVIIIGNSGI